VKITSNLFEAYLKCPSKSWLLSQGEVRMGNTYAVWFHDQNESYRSEGIRRLLGDFCQNECAIALPGAVNVKSTNWRIAVDMIAQTRLLEARLDALERVQSGDEGKADQLIPICFALTQIRRIYQI
jgi:hypothetical protein